MTPDTTRGWSPTSPQLGSSRSTGGWHGWVPVRPPRSSCCVTNPSNVGMIIRSAAGAGLSGVVLPEVGSPDIGPLVVRASAGIALRTTILRCPSAAAGTAALADAGLAVHGLRTAGAEVLFTSELGERAAYVLGNETDGISAPVAALVERWLAIPMARGVESLNVASAAAVLAFEVARRRP